MPMYSTKCTKCGKAQEQKLSFAEYDLMSSGEFSLACSCNEGFLSIEFNPGDVKFTLKDGPSGGWASKALKENKYRARRGEIMAQREKDHVFKSKLVPNYQGQEANSWKDVQDHVRSEKKGAEGELAASTYESLVKKEIAK
jgi:hypothetical protein